MQGPERPSEQSSINEDNGITEEENIENDNTHFELHQESKEEEEKEDEEPFNRLIQTRSGRVSQPVHKYVTMHQGHLQTQSISSTEYTSSQIPSQQSTTNLPRPTV
jgi:hypothetical protein